MRRILFLLGGCLVAPSWGLAAAPPATSSSSHAVSAQSVIKAMVVEERGLVLRLRKYHPIVETYIQNLRPDPKLGNVPVKDHYYLGQLDYRQALEKDDSYLQKPPANWKKQLVQRLDPLNPLDTYLASFYSMHFLNAGFVSMLFPDPSRFDPGSYRFRYIRQEFLGNVRCYVFNVRPRHGIKGAFLGRIWVEARHDHLVRFNGTFVPQMTFGRYFHFDSWRVNVRPGLWVPTFVYSEESDLRGTSLFGFAGHARFAAETHIWGYQLNRRRRASTASQMIVEGAVKDHASSSDGYSPIEAERLWQREAENNVLHRLQKAGMLAPPGPVDKMLETVVNNLEITNHLNIEPAVRCRVLLVTPLVAFSIGHTIVLSRGLIDVLPDEPSLALMLARGLAAIVKGEPIDTKFAFFDRMLIPNDQVFKKFQLRLGRMEQSKIDRETVALMQRSPYKNQLGQVGLFLEAMRARAKALPHLMGSAIISAPLVKQQPASHSAAWLQPLLKAAPPLEFASVKQIEALPLGSRLQLSPWSDGLSLLKTPPISLMSAAEKMPFQVTPQRPYLHRVQSPSEMAVADTQPAAR